MYESVTKQPSAVDRQPYTKPALIHLGDLRTLTLGASPSDVEPDSTGAGFVVGRLGS